MNSPSSFPAQGYRENAKLNDQVRASNNKKISSSQYNKNTLKDILQYIRGLQAIGDFDYWQNFPMGSSIIAKVSGSRVALELSHKDPRVSLQKARCRSIPLVQCFMMKGPPISVLLSPWHD